MKVHFNEYSHYTLFSLAIATVNIYNLALIYIADILMNEDVFVATYLHTGWHVTFLLAILRLYKTGVKD
jgi:hypothetical protein